MGPELVEQASEQVFIDVDAKGVTDLLRGFRVPEPAYPRAASRPALRLSIPQTSWYKHLVCPARADFKAVIISRITD